MEHIGHTLGTTQNAQLSWFMSSYALGGGVFVLVTGRLGDHFGHKYVFMAGWIWIAIWSLVSGFADDVILFDIARGFTGVGNAALVPNSFALLGRAFPPFSTKKNIGFAFLGFCAPAGYIFGGVVGAAFAQNVTWRWGFWFWAIGSLVMSVAAWIVVPLRIGNAIPGLSLWQFDYVGTLLGVSGLVLFAFAWSQSPVVGWEEPYTYALLVPLVIGGFFATASVGLFIMKVPAQYIFGVSMFSFFIGNLLMSFAEYSDSYWAFIFPACLFVVGGPDLSFASSGILVSDAVLPEEQGVAGSFIQTVVQYSIAIGLGIAATVETHVNKGNTDIMLGYRGALWLGIGFAAVAFFIVALFVRDHRFDRSEEGGEIKSRSSRDEEDHA